MWPDFIRAHPFTHRCISQGVFSGVAAGKREQVVHDAAGALGFGRDGLQIVPEHVVQLLAETELREAEDGSERVVELMSDSGGHLSH
jgi:hypothetical protein